MKAQLLSVMQKQFPMALRFVLAKLDKPQFGTTVVTRP